MPIRFIRRTVLVPPQNPEDKARDLLWSKLTAGQRETLRYGYFDVTGSRGGHYRISTDSTVQNITKRSRFGIGAGFCVGPADPMPRGDVLLCQKVLIESDEDLFRRTAVKYRFGYTW